MRRLMGLLFCAALFHPTLTASDSLQTTITLQAKSYISRMVTPQSEQSGKPDDATTKALGFDRLVGGRVPPARGDRARSRHRAAHRRRHRQGPAARTGRDRPLAELLLPAPAPCPPTWPGAGGGHRRRHPGAARPGAVPRQPVVGQAGLRAGPVGRGPGRAGHAGRGERRRCPTRPGSRWSRVGTTAELRDARAQGRRRRRRRW